MYTHIEDNIYSIPVPLPNNPLRELNAYVIKGKDRSLLIDTGFRQEECRRALTEGLAELGVSMEETDIFVTHLHSDHSGLAPELASGSTRVFIGREDGSRLLHFDDPNAREKLLNCYVEYGFSEAELGFMGASPMVGLAAAPYRDYVLLDEGETLSYGGHELRLICTPGHTPGHMCLWEAERGVMFLGDHVLFSITPNITSWPGFTDPLGNYIHSLLAVSGYPVRLPLPAHRQVTGSMSERVGAIIEHHGVRVREVLDTLDAHPGSTAYETASHLSWNIRAQGGWAGFPIAQKWFAVGEAAAHLEYLVCRDRVRTAMDGPVRRYWPEK